MSSVFGEIVIALLLFMIRGIVLDEVDPVTAPIKGGQQHLIDKGQIGFPLKIVFLMQIGEFGVVQANRSKDFLGMAFAAGRNLRLLAPSRPSGVESGRLAKGSFVLENDHRPFALGVFFSLG